MRSPDDMVKHLNIIKHHEHAFSVWISAFTPWILIRAYVQCYGLDHITSFLSSEAPVWLTIDINRTTWKALVCGKSTERACSRAGDPLFGMH